MFLLTRPGAAANEDAVGAGPGFLFVIDGATGLSGQVLRCEPSDAAWFARETASLLGTLLSDPSLDTRQALRRAMDTLRARWPGAPEDAPSAGIAIFRVRGNCLEHTALGDCAGSAELWDGTFRCWEDTALTALDRGALEEMVRLHRTQGLTMPQAREAIAPLLRHNRALRNTPAGYWSLDPTAAGIDHARCALLPLADVRSLFLCSDGFAQLIGFGAAPDLAGLHRLCLRDGLDAPADRLYALQEDDRAMLRLPRFKLRDDTSAILAAAKEILP